MNPFPYLKIMGATRSGCWVNLVEPSGESLCVGNAKMLFIHCIHAFSRSVIALSVNKRKLSKMSL